MRSNTIPSDAMVQVQDAPIRPIRSNTTLQDVLYAPMEFDLYAPIRPLRAPLRPIRPTAIMQSPYTLHYGLYDPIRRYAPIRPIRSTTMMQESNTLPYDTPLLSLANAGLQTQRVDELHVPPGFRCILQTRPRGTTGDVPLLHRIPPRGPRAHSPRHGPHAPRGPGYDTNVSTPRSRIMRYR